MERINGTNGKASTSSAINVSDLNLAESRSRRDIRSSNDVGLDDFNEEDFESSEGDDYKPARYQNKQKWTGVPHAKFNIIENNAGLPVLKQSSTLPTSSLSKSPSFATGTTGDSLATSWERMPSNDVVNPMQATTLGLDLESNVHGASQQSYGRQATSKSGDILVVHEAKRTVDREGGICDSIIVDRKNASDSMPLAESHHVSQPAVLDQPGADQRFLISSESAQDDVENQGHEERNSQDLTEPLLGGPSNDKKQWPTSFSELSPKVKAALVIWAFITAIQTTLNSFSVSHNFIYQEDANCAVGEFNCYSSSAWRDWRSIFVLYFIMSTLSLNVMIFLYYGPKAFARMFTLETWKTPKGYAAALLAAAASVVSYKQGIDALTLFSNFLTGTKVDEIFGKILDISMLTASVSSTFCTREEGAFTLMELYQLRYYGFYLDRIPYLMNDAAKKEYENRRFALSVKDALYAYEYDLTVAQRTQLLTELNDIFKEQGQQQIADPLSVDLTVIMTRPNRGCVEYVYQSVYWLAKAAFLFLAAVSYGIIYNIVASAFSGIIWKCLTPVVALTSPIFYLSTLGRMPDAEARVFKKMMFYDAKTPQEQINNFGIYIAQRMWLPGSCGNFLYSALAQVNQGLFDYLGMSRLAATGFWGADGAAVSLYVNWFAACNIYIEETDDPDLYKASQKAQTHIKKAILEGGEPLEKLVAVYKANYPQTIFAENAGFTYNPLAQAEHNDNSYNA